MHIVADIPRVSVVAPAHNEAENIHPLVQGVADAMDETKLPYEIVIVDDGSTDSTLDELRNAGAKFSQLHVIRMLDTPADRGHGQSAAFHAAFRACRGELIVMLDADLQNDPTDIPAMLKKMQDTGADMVQGDRTESRPQRDGLVRSTSSHVGRLFRRWLLGDTIIDTGCSLRVMTRDVAMAIPLEFRGMHRFIPITARQLGFTVVETPVSHRPRVAGRAKYGIWNRALPGLIDCLAVRWMHRRRRPVAFENIQPLRSDTQTNTPNVAEQHGSMTVMSNEQLLSSEARS